jgi:hypothetical protein
VLLEQATHAGAENQLFPDGFGSLADLGKDPVEGAVVEREDVVSGCLDEEEPLELV